MEEAGLKPIPVIHEIVGDEIQYYIDEGYQKVAIGSSQITDFETLYYVVKKFEGTNVKLHLFGTVKYHLIAYLPIHSCDTSSWVYTGQYGYIRYYNKHKGKTDKIYLDEYMHPDKKHKIHYSSYEFRYELDRYWDEELNIGYEHLLGNAGTFYKQLVNLHYLVQLEERVNQMHKDYGFRT